MEQSQSFLIIDSSARECEIYSALIQEVEDSKIEIAASVTKGFEILNSALVCRGVILDSETCGNVLGVVERIRSEFPGTHIIVISKKGTIEEAVKSIRLGAEDYFLKPVNPDKLKLSIKRCFASHDLFELGNSESSSSYLNLISSCQIISAMLDEQRVCEAVMNYLRRETDCEGLGLFKSSGNHCERIATNLDKKAQFIDQKIVIASLIEDKAENLQTCKVIPNSPDIPELYIYSFRILGDCDYFIVCVSPKLRRAFEESVSMFKLLQAQILLTGKNIQNYRGVRDLLYLDDATGLYNARFLNVSLDQAFEQLKNTGKSFAVMFLDVDHFKNVNDNYGHIVGTQLLLEMGDVLKREVRVGDTICRYGGDEFVLILPGVDVNTASEIGERIRAAVEARTFLELEKKKLKLTVSIGVAICPLHAASKTEILEAADTAMYQAKKSSRNFVYIANYIKKSA